MKDTAENKIWKRIAVAVSFTLLGLFFAAFPLALLVDRGVISLVWGERGMYILLFVLSFISGFFIRTPSRQTYMTVLSGLVSFAFLVLLGFICFQKFSAENAVTVLIILLSSAIINSVVKAIK